MQTIRIFRNLKNDGSQNMFLRKNMANIPKLSLLSLLIWSNDNHEPCFLLLLQFLQQYRHYQSTLQIFQLKSSQYSKTLDELLIFLAQVSWNLHRNQVWEYLALQIRRGKRDYYGIIFHSTPFKHILWPIIRTVSVRGHNICFRWEIRKIMNCLIRSSCIQGDWTHFHCVAAIIIKGNNLWDWLFASLNSIPYLFGCKTGFSSLLDYK